jgi:hypothetical protein
MLRKLKWQILAARYNWCQGPVPGRGPAVEKHCLNQLRYRVLSVLWYYSAATKFNFLQDSEILTVGQIKCAVSGIVLRFGVHLVLVKMKMKIIELKKKQKIRSWKENVQQCYCWQQNVNCSIWQQWYLREQAVSVINFRKVTFSFLASSRKPSH